MNRNRFAILYNEARGQWVVVRESASAKGAPRYGGAVGMLLGPLLASLVLGSGPIQAQIAADPAAPAVHRPVLDTTANGRPLVQITAPSAAGVSKNLFTHFNVDPQGVILNNARSVTLTQQGGYVAPNPHLPASARVILNQVTGTAPTSIRGYLEVAGQRADVVVANPNGIACNGGGFINTARGVLTTGTPVMGSGGNLETFRTTSGRIRIGEAGFDGTGLDQLDLIARSVEVNGQLWSGQRLNVVAGAHQVDYASLGVQVLQGEGDPPAVGIDVAQLGGMYAGKIHLVGTEAGVGVHSQGVLAAQAGDFTLRADGRITLEGSTVSAGTLTVSGREDLRNSGTLYAQGNVTLAAQRELANTGSLSSGGDLAATAASIVSTGALGAGIDADGLATHPGSLRLSASGTLALDNAIARDDLELSAGRLDLARATLTAGDSATLAASGDIDQRQGDLMAYGSLAVAAGGAWNHQGGRILAGGSASVAAARLDNRDGLLGAEGDLVLQVQDSLDNLGGTLYASRDLALEAGGLAGAGTVLAGRNAVLDLTGDATLAAGGRIAAGERLAVNVTGNLANAGDLEAEDLNVQAWSLDNRETGLVSGSQVILLGGDSLVNTGRVFGDSVALQAGRMFLNADQGIVASRGTLDIAAHEVANQEGSWLYADGDLSIGGALDESRRATGAAHSLYNGSALIQSENGDVSIRAASVQNINDRLRVEQRETSRTGFVRITPNHSSVSYDASQLTPTKGKDGIGSCYRLPDGTLVMSYTRIDGTRTVTNTFVTESAPARILAGGDIRIDSGTCLNSDSQIIAGGDLDVIAPDNDGDVNRGTMGYEITSEIGTARYTWTEWHGDKEGRKRYWSGATSHAPAPVYDPRPLGLAVMLDHAAPDPNGNPAGSQGPGTLSLPAVPSSLLLDLSGHGPLQTVGNSGSPIPNLSLPGSRLYQLHTTPGSTYLVETDPRFTQYRTFMGSDYLLSRLPGQGLAGISRLGDGFFETQLVSRQIETLTGRKFLEGYTNAFDAFQALMDHGLTVAESFQLEPGVALSEAQMAALTSDIVWLVKQSVALPDGTQQDVLVPVVYLARVHAQDLQPTGALMSGENLSLFTSHALDNTGTLLAGNRLSLSAQDLANRGRIQAGGDVLLDATRNAVNEGRLSGSRVAILAGNDVLLQSAVRQTAGATGTAAQIDRVSTLTADRLDIQAGRDLVLQGARLDISGDAALAAGRNLDVNAVTTSAEERLVWDARNRRSQSQEAVVGSEVNAGGDLTLAAGQDVATQAAILTSGQALRIQAAGDVTLGTAQESASFDEAHYHKTKGTLSTRRTATRTTQDQTLQVGTIVSGDTVVLQSGRDLAVTGSSVAGTGDVALSAGRDLSIEAATNTQAATSYSRTSRSGLMSGGDFGFTVGTREQTDRLAQDGALQSASRSLVGSTDGSLTVTAGRDARVSGSDLVAAQDLSFTAASVTLDPGLDRTRLQESHDFEQSGLTVAVSSPVLAAAQTLHTMKNAATESKDPRVRALAAATAGLATKNAVDAVTASPTTVGGVTVSATIGSSRSHSESQSTATTTAGSLVQAGRNVSITATEQDLTVVGSTIQAGNDVHLEAAGNLNLLASRDTRETTERSSGSGWGVGVAATYGPGGWAAGVTANASASRGRGQGSDTTHTNTRVTAGGTASLESGGDTALKGAVVTGEQVTATVGGNLAIESLQDTSTYRSQDRSAGGSVTVGIGFAASANASRQRMDSDYTSVTEPSGLQAGDDGFQVTVQGHTDLKGAVIASTETAVADGRNSFTTGSLSMTDLENHAEYEAKGSSVTFGGQISSWPTKAPAGDAKGPLSVTPLTGGGTGERQGEASSVTRSGISGIAGNAAVRSGDTAGGIAPIFHADEVRKELNAQVTVTQAFNQLAPVAARDYANKRIRELKEEYDASTDAARRAELANEMKNWQPTGAYTVALDVLIGATGGNLKSTLTKETLALAADKMRDVMIADSKKFKGIKDKDGNIFSNESGESAGVNGDHFKLGGGRINLAAWEKEGYIERCDSDKPTVSGYEEDGNGYVIISRKCNKTIDECLAAIPKWVSPLGGHQGSQGIIGIKKRDMAFEYEPGSLFDSLVESYAGTHDALNSFIYYDDLGNNKKLDGTLLGRIGSVANGMNVVLATPFGMSVFLPQEVWNAIHVVLH